MPERADQNERDFREFSAKLLQAEEEGFQSEDHKFYTPEALRKILKGFCNIIAENLQVQSCTVLLKLYDLRSCPALEEFLNPTGSSTTLPAGPIAALRDDSARKFRGRWDDALSNLPEAVGGSRTQSAEAYRQQLLHRTTAFPHALFAKGCMWHAAVNDTGPWSNCVPWLHNELRGGITADIVQGKTARVKDRFAIRSTRSFWKLGTVDRYIWTNNGMRDRNGKLTESPRFFFTYYGVPIRLHHWGDVVGVLKVENKGLAYRGGAATPHLETIHQELLELLRKRLQCPVTSKSLSRSLLKIQKKAKLKHLSFSTSSVISLAYLAADLSSYGQAEMTLEDLCCLSYPTPYEPLPFNFPRQEDAAKPPVQLFFESLDKELAFLGWLTSQPVQPGEPLTNKVFNLHVKCASEFYNSINNSPALLARTSKILDGDIEEAVKTALQSKRVQITVARSVADRDIRQSPPFLRRVRVVSLEDGAQSFEFHVQVCPSIAEVVADSFTRKGFRYFGLEFHEAVQYKWVNGTGGSQAPQRGETVGESVSIEGFRIVHLHTDRLAARVQAFTHAFPIPEFDETDARWLSWAALEIGKLIERQISYRGTGLKPVVPLTAMDFYHVPISDLSFVDDLRLQHDQAIKAQGMLQYHVPNACWDTGIDITDEKKTGYRIKDFRSYLERLGQGHRAHFDALISVWLYLLSLKILPQSAILTGEAKEFCLSLQLFRDALESFCETNWPQRHREQQGGASFGKAKATLKEVLSNGEIYYGDLMFMAPAMALELDLKQQRSALMSLADNLANSPQPVTELLVSNTDPAAIAELVFRRYDAFFVRAASLYICIYNCLNNRDEYKQFYGHCLTLTRILTDAYEQSYQRFESFVSGVTAEPGTTRALMVALRDVRSKATLETEEFCTLLGEEKGNAVYLTIEGIYKRVRTLFNISANQLPPQILNWETARFDYLGARVNCLFKNQIFAVYEQLWSRGDPFLEHPEHGPQKPETASRAHDRQRWFCLRTKIHQGRDGYNAWQISALMDSNAVSDPYWSWSLYNLHKLRSYLAAAFERSHKAEFEKYWKLSKRRYAYQAVYQQWHRLFQGFVQGDSVRRAGGEVLFGLYLCQTPFDIFVRLLEEQAGTIEAVNELREDFRPIVGRILDFVRAARAYSDRFDKELSLGDQTRELSGLARLLYQDAKEIATKYAGRNLLQELDPQISILDRESQVIEEASRAGSGLPMIYCSQEPTDSITESLKALAAVMAGSYLGDEINVLWQKGLQHLLVRFQSMQRDFLFDLEGGSGAHLRDDGNVLERILFYILTFNAREDLRRFPGWTAYDLFYYLVSLVPVELQVRTALADTMAEQYHPVYKANPDPGSTSSLQQWRMKEIGNKLELIDREIEVQYEDYLSHRWLGYKEK